MALVHCLARDAAETEPGADPPPELVDEGIFRAARFGVHGELPDADGRLRSVSELLEGALERAARRAPELRCVEDLARLDDLIQRGGGAGLQRATYEIAGIDAVVRHLTEVTMAPVGSSEAD